MGYFQKAKQVPNLERAQVAVRRLTGGGAIHHAKELTFSITCAARHALYAGEVRRSYEAIHGAIAEVLGDYAVQASFRGQGALLSDKPATGMCFEHSTDLDLAWDGSKGVGSAQRRTGGRVLHHGSIKLGRSDLDASVAALWDHTPDVSPQDLAGRLCSHFAQRFDLDFETDEPTRAEAEHAQRRAEHFTSQAFIHRR